MSHIKQKLSVVFISIALLLFMVIAWSACKKSSDTTTTEPGQLTLHPTGVRIVSLRGNYIEMGMQYGNHMRADLKKWADYYNNTWKNNNPLIYNFITEKVLEDVNKLFLSPKIKDFISGEALTSGLSLTDLYRLDQCLAFDYLFSGDISALPMAACTFIGAYGQATGGHTIVARNLDLQRPLAVRDYNSVITIMHPTNGDHAVATFGFVGFPQGYALLNLDNTVFAEYNTGNSSDGGVDPLPGARDMMDVAFDAVTEKSNTDATTTAEYLRTSRLLSPAFFGCADMNNVFVVQRPMLAQGIITRNSLGNFINGVTNVFLDSNIFGVKLTIYNASTAPDAAEKKLDTPGRGMIRWTNLVRYFSTHSSGVDVNSMKTIISKNIADTGVFITGYEVQGTSSYCKQDATFGSVVIDLNDLSQVWWLRYDYATKNKTWDNIDLKQYIR